MVNIDNFADKKNDIDILNGIITDMAALRTAITAITAKLDADGGVTDTDYAASCDPVALTTTT